MTRSARTVLERLGRRILLAAFVAFTAPDVSSQQHPLEPPDRSSPRATLRTFLEGVDAAWELYAAGDPGFQRPFTAARDCLDLSELPPLVSREIAAETALTLKEVLDRLELPPEDEIPDQAAIDEAGTTRWTLPHTEIRMVRVAEGEREGQWLFSAGTVERTPEYYERIEHLPYQPGRTGGHIEALRMASDARLLLELRKLLPWTDRKVGGLSVWQWLGLAAVVVILVLCVVVLAWIGRRSRGSSVSWLGRYLVPFALASIPFVGSALIDRLFVLPGAPARLVRLVFSLVGDIGLAWLLSLVLTSLGDGIVRLWFRDARPLKKQLVRVLARVATILVVTAILLQALQLVGVPVAGLIAGVGVGGLAIALAAQGTLENFIGGIILYADHPVKVGDLCRFGQRRGTVEDVGLRSVKLRTLDRSIVTVPNADFAKMQLENLSERDRILMREELCLRYETTAEQLQNVLTELEAMLAKHPQIDDEPRRVRFTGFGRYYLELELFAYALTNDWSEFLSIRQDVLTQVMQIIDRSGTRLALPTEVHYAAAGEQRSGAESAPPGGGAS